MTTEKPSFYTSLFINYFFGYCPFLFFSWQSFWTYLNAALLNNCILPPPAHRRIVIVYVCFFWRRIQALNINRYHLVLLQNMFRRVDTHLCTNAQLSTPPWWLLISLGCAPCIFDQTPFATTHIAMQQFRIHGQPLALYPTLNQQKF